MTTIIYHHDTNHDKSNTNDNIIIANHHHDVIDDEMKNILINYGTSKNGNDDDMNNNNTYRIRQHEEYLKRLRTFHDNIHLFFGKPIELSPIVCSLWGWKFHSKDTIQCTSCNAICNIMSIPTTISIQSQYNMIQMFQQQIINKGHHNYCIYHNIYNCYQHKQPQQQQSLSSSSSSLLTLFTIWTRILPERTIALLESTNPWNLFMRHCHNISHFPFHDDHTLINTNDHNNDDDYSNNNRKVLHKSVAKLIPSEMIKYFHNSIMIKGNDQFDTVKDNDNTDNEEDRIIMLLVVQQIIEPFIEMILVHHDKQKVQQELMVRSNRERRFIIAASVILTLLGWEIPTMKQQNENQLQQQGPLHDEEQYVLQCPFCGVQRSSKLLLSNLPITSSWKKQQEKQQLEQNDPLDDRVNNNERNTKRLKLDNSNHHDINSKRLFDTSLPTMINPLNSHRYYCPYVCGMSSSSIPLSENTKQDICNDTPSDNNKSSIPSQSSSSLSQPLWQIVFDRLYTSLPESIISKMKENTEKSRQMMIMQNNGTDSRTNLTDEDIVATSLIDETRNVNEHQMVTDSSTTSTTNKTNDCHDNNSMTPFVTKENNNNNNSNDNDNKNDSYNAWLEIHQILRSGISLKKIPSSLLNK